MLRAFLLLISISAIMSTYDSSSLSSPETKRENLTWSKTISAEDCQSQNLKLLVPFYEGIEITDPQVMFRKLKTHHIDLMYPGTLSMPFFAWQCESSQNTWNYVAVRNFQNSVSLLSLKWQETAEGDGAFVTSLACKGNCSFFEGRSQQSFSQLKNPLRQEWSLKSPFEPLSKHFDRLHFYVHEWITNDPNNRLQMNWSIPDLVSLMQKDTDSENKAIHFVWGLFPGNADLGGVPFFNPESTRKAREILAANPRRAHLAWLNLRTNKFSIPALGLEVPEEQRLLSAAKLHRSGLKEQDQYTFRWVEMCTGAKAWQEFRLEQFERLVDLGFKVIQLDEFPLSYTWGDEPCFAEDHDHKPGSSHAEWQAAQSLLRRIAERAKEHGVFLTTEEPSMVTLPYTSGYIDRIANDEPDIYGFWTSTGKVRPVPLFSSIFGDVVTPYSDIDPERDLPEGWLKMTKRYPEQ